MLDGFTLNNRGAARLFLDDSPFGLDLAMNNGVVINNSGTFEMLVDRDITYGGVGTSPTFNNTGLFRLAVEVPDPGRGGRAVLGMTFNNTATVEVRSGTLDFRAGYTQTGESSVTILGGGNITATTFDIQGGLVSGSGTITAPVGNTGGVFAPGGSPGIMSVVGTYMQAAAGSLNIELGGLTAGSEYDQLNVIGSVALDGSLDVGFIGAFLPTLGDSFTILDNDGTDAVTGQFTGLPEGAIAPIGLFAFEISYQGGSDNNDVVLTVVNIQPVLTLVGPTDGVRGQPRTFELLVEDTANDLAAGFTYLIDWGDGSDPDGDGTPGQTVTGPSGLRVSHGYTEVGPFDITAIATDQFGAASDPASHQIVITAVAVLPDPCGGQALVVGGTTANDNIVLESGKWVGSILFGFRCGHLAWAAAHTHRGL